MPALTYKQKQMLRELHGLIIDCNNAMEITGLQAIEDTIGAFANDNGAYINDVSEILESICSNLKDPEEQNTLQEIIILLDDMPLKAN